MNSKTLLICVFVLFVFITGTIYFTYNKQENGLHYNIERSKDLDTEEVLSEDVSEEIIEVVLESENTELIVHLFGCIASEGVYTLEQGSRVYEALELAGGYSEGASKGYVNLARYLEDGESIYFPTIEEEQSIVEEEIVEVDDGLTNINTATINELIELPGIGDTKARSIIAYRTMNGEFGQIEDIMNVSGIKESLFMTIKDMISV